MTCPCGSGREYADCCGPLHTGRVEAPTAEALMRARYAAFAVGDAAYLERTWHPARRRTDGPGATLSAEVRWTRLRILDVSGGGPDDDTGEVAFRAHFRGPDGPGVIAERSRFVRHGGAWVYESGTQDGR